MIRRRHGGCAVATLLASGCARLVTLDPATVATRNDETWSVRSAPRVAEAPAPVAPAADAPAADAPAADAPAADAPAAVAPAAVAPAAVAPAAVVLAAEVPAAEAPTVVQPLPFAQRPEVLQALRSAPDDQGIPASLYAVDPLLSAHRREMASQARARHQVGAGVLVSGLVFCGLSAWAIAWGSAHTNDPKNANEAAQLIGDGVVIGALSVGDIIAGIVLAASGADPGPLRHYYRETYGTTPAGPP